MIVCCGGGQPVTASLPKQQVFVRLLKEEVIVEAMKYKTFFTLLLRRLRLRINLLEVVGWEGVFVDHSLPGGTVVDAMDLSEDDGRVDHSEEGDQDLGVV